MPDWFAIVKDLAEKVPGVIESLKVHHPEAVTAVLGQGNQEADDERTKALERGD